MGLRVALLVGGVPAQRQVTELSKIPHIVVATPGRCLDLVSGDDSFQKYIKNTKYLILDEVDRLMEE